MHIYVDFDDCLCETARAFSKLALEMFNKHVPYDRIHFFELDRSFELDAEQYERFMFRGHEPEILLSFDATPGAAKTINEWISCGHEVSIITGRPSSVCLITQLRILQRRSVFSNICQNLRFWCLTGHGTENVLFRMKTIKDVSIGRAFAGLFLVSAKETCNKSYNLSRYR